MFLSEGWRWSYQAAGGEKGISLKEWSSRQGYKHLTSPVSLTELCTYYLISALCSFPCNAWHVSFLVPFLTLQFFDLLFFTILINFTFTPYWITLLLSFSADLQNAIQSENYDKAALLRDEISKLETESLAVSIKAQAYINTQFAFRLGQKMRHKKFGKYCPWLRIAYLWICHKPQTN